MPSPRPINAIQTRVVKDANGIHWPQFSTDGLNWFPLASSASVDAYKAACRCADFARVTGEIPAQGEVVWRSKA